MKKFAIFGNGKVTLRIVRGFIKAGISAKSILVIKRPNSTTNVKKLETLGVTVTDIIQKVRDIKTVIFSVRPVDAPALFVSLNGLLTDNHTIISIVSQATIERISHDLHISNSSITRMTLNTNVDHCCGVIAATGKRVELFEKIGLVIYMKGHSVKKMVAGIGSMNALDLLFIKRYAKAFSNGVSNEAQAVPYAYTKVLEYTQMLETSKVYSTSKIKEVATSNGWGNDYIHLWMESKIEAYRSIGISEYDRVTIAIQTLKSSALVLQQEGVRSIAGINQRVRTVLTKKGCTREYYYKLARANSIERMIFRLPHALQIIYGASKKLFPK